MRGECEGHHTYLLTGRAIRTPFAHAKVLGDEVVVRRIGELLGCGLVPNRPRASAENGGLSTVCLELPSNYRAGRGSDAGPLQQDAGTAPRYFIHGICERNTHETQEAQVSWLAPVP
jgi:hypothetical protein